MKERRIDAASAGRKLGRELEKLLPQAPKGFFFKALRNNKIKVNGRKPVDLNVILQEGDVLKLFFTDEQWASFGGKEDTPAKRGDYRPQLSRELEDRYRVTSHIAADSLCVLYEDDNLLIVNKPAGLLSQKDASDEPSVNEYVCEYLAGKGELGESFRPGVQNRLDRNTSGAVIIAKNVLSAQALGEMIAGHGLGKYYAAVVEGTVEWERKRLLGLWTKDEEKNLVTVRAVDAAEASASERAEDGKLVECVATLIEQRGKTALLEVKLISGKSHQIRAQLAEAGHPLVGDKKYGASIGHRLLLCAKKLVFEHCPEALRYMEGKTVEAPIPDAMKL